MLQLGWPVRERLAMVVVARVEVAATVSVPVRLAAEEMVWPLTVPEVSWPTVVVASVLVPVTESVPVTPRFPLMT